MIFLTSTSSETYEVAVAVFAMPKWKEKQPCFDDLIVDESTALMLHSSMEKLLG